MIEGEMSALASEDSYLRNQLVEHGKCQKGFEALLPILLILLSVCSNLHTKLLFRDEELWIDGNEVLASL